MPSNLDLAGIPDLTRRLRAMETEMTQALGAALYQHGQKILTKAREESPVRNRGGGVLRASAFALPPEIVGGTISVTVGFGGAAARYAAAAHENPRTGRTGGFSPSGQRYSSWSEVGKYHFLSDPIKEDETTLVDDLAATVLKVLRRHVAH